MQKGDPSSPGSPARGVIDGLVARAAAGREGRVEIGDPEAEVVNPGAMTFEEPGDRRARFRREEELDPGVTQGDRDDGRPIDGFLGAGLEAEYLSVERESLVEVGDGDPDVRQMRLRRCGHEP